jgi:hypothetical protein
MIAKFLHFLKMSWMLSWRLLFVDALVFRGGHDTQFLIAAVLFSGFMVFFLNKTLTAFPLIRLVMRKPVVVWADGFSGDNEPRVVKSRPVTPKEKVELAKPEPEPVRYIKTATSNGYMTGFEPSALANVPIPSISMMDGVPGAGLSGDTGMDEGAVRLGIMGEENFARALSMTRLISRFQSVWSVPVPHERYFEIADYDADVDCVIASGTCIYLVDLKNYKSGNVRYYHKGNQLYCEDVATGSQVGEPKTMSRNMHSATAAMRHHFPNAVIKPVVVLMPTDKGEGIIDNVMWPGQIQAMNLSQFISQLQADRDFSYNLPHAGAMSRIARLAAMKRKRDEQREHDKKREHNIQKERDERAIRYGWDERNE